MVLRDGTEGWYWEKGDDTAGGAASPGWRLRDKRAPAPPLPQCIGIEGDAECSLPAAAVGEGFSKDSPAPEEEGSDKEEQ